MLWTECERNICTFWHTKWTAWSTVCPTSKLQCMKKTGTVQRLHWWLCWSWSWQEREDQRWGSWMERRGHEEYWCERRGHRGEAWMEVEDLLRAPEKEKNIYLILQSYWLLDCQVTSQTPRCPTWVSPASWFLKESTQPRLLSPHLHSLAAADERSEITSQHQLTWKDHIYKSKNTFTQSLWLHTM